MKKNRVRDGRVAASAVLLLVIAALFLTSYIQIYFSIRERSIGRLEEGLSTVSNELVSKFEREGRILKSTADIISATDNFDVDAMIEMVSTVAPLLSTMQIRILLPDDRILTPSGTVVDAGETSVLSFEEEAAHGQHVSRRSESLTGELVLRQFVPIIQDGKTAAMLFGVTYLKDLPELLNISNIYNGTADIYIIDTNTGDFILDTAHDTLGNTEDYRSGKQPDRKTKGKLGWNEFAEDMEAGGSGYVVFRTDETDGWEYMCYAPLEVNEEAAKDWSIMKTWAISVSVPESEAFTSVYAVQRVYYVVGALMLVAVAIYYIVISRMTKRVVTDSVERAVLEEKLKKAEAAERAKTTFLSNMSHDIRTPMNAIIGFTTLAESNIDNKPRVQEYLAKIMSSSNHLLSLINDILDMSRIESGKLNIEEKPCSLSDIFRDMRNIIQTQMQSKQLSFFMDTFDIVDEDIYCDKLHVNQVLLNLLSNSIKFTPSGGSVSLMVKQKPGAPSGYGAYEIRVKDTGIGMSPEFATHIFEPFERERNSTVSGIQGTGLGMAITKNIVDAMGGTIEVQTEQGHGTEFIINLKFRLQTETKPVTVIHELSGVRGLVVDDSFSTCDSVTKMLTQIGMRAEWTMHGKEAVLRAKQAIEMGDDYYVYIIDWQLPDLSGLEVVRQIRAIVGNEAPIVILTAYDWTAIEEEAKAAGVTAFCNKPIFLSELRDTLITAIGKGEGDVKANAAEPVPDPVEKLRGMRLLLVEDNELNREIAQELLEESGLKVETAENGAIAVDMVGNSTPGYYALVLMDVQMPVMNGYEASRAIRSLIDPRLSKIPIVAMTANAFDEDKREAMANGMNDHIAKPINIDKLIQVLVAQLSDEPQDGDPQDGGEGQA